MLTDFDVIIILGSFFLAIVLLYVKMHFHFEYLKFEKGRFRNIDSLLSLYFKPCRAFEYPSDLVIIMWVPILTYGNSFRKKKVFVLTWMIIALLSVAIIYYMFAVH